jgi:hypothetical protein
VSFTLTFIRAEFIVSVGRQMSPQIRCPNCGITINSENRRKIDLSMIVRAVQKKPQSFTDLLKMTKLPRKTLSIRLKDLVGMNIIKKNGLYYLNEEADTKELVNVQKPPIVIRRKVLLALLVLAVMAPVSLQAYAMFQANLFAPPQPVVKGYFTATLYIANVQDLYGWSAVISYDSDHTNWIEILPGSIDELPYALNNTFPEMGLLLVGNTLIGDDPGITVSDRAPLISIKFAYYSEDYTEPSLLSEYLWHETKLLNSNKEPISTDTLTFEIE